MTEQWRVTLLSAVVPGWGQLELGHRWSGFGFVGAAAALVIGLIGTALVGRGETLALLALLELTGWASLHAWLVAARRSAPGPRA